MAQILTFFKVEETDELGENQFVILRVYLIYEFTFDKHFLKVIYRSL